MPNVIQGLFRRRRTAVALATKTGVDGLAVGFMAGLRRSYGHGPVWIRVFSHGPQGCPGAGIALFVGKAMLGKLLRDRDVRLLEPALGPHKLLSHMLDFFSLQFELPARL